MSSQYKNSVETFSNLVQKGSSLELNTSLIKRGALKAYWRNLYGNALDVIQDYFPNYSKAVGKKQLKGAVSAYLKKYGCDCWSLNSFGNQFPECVRHLERSNSNKANLLADIAYLDFVFQHKKAPKSGEVSIQVNALKFFFRESTEDNSSLDFNSDQKIYIKWITNPEGSIEISQA